MYLREKRILMVFDKNSMDNADKHGLFKEWYLLLSNFDNFFEFDYVGNVFKLGIVKAKELLIEYIELNQIEVVLFFAIEYDLIFIEKIRSMAYVLRYSGDDSAMFNIKMKYLAQSIDNMLIFDNDVVCKYSELGLNATFFQIYYNDNLYKKLNITKDIDVSFVGTIRTGERKESVNFLNKNGIEVDVYGIGSKNGKISFEEMVKVFNQTKINLCFNKIVLEKGTENSIMDRILHIKARNYEVPLSGSFLLTEYVKGLENIYEIGKEIEVFYDEKDMLEKIKFYLKNDDKREEIALNGYKKAISKYTLRNFEQNLSNIVEKGLKNKVYKPSKIYIDNDFNKMRTIYDIKIAFKFIKSKKYRYAYEAMQYIYYNGKIDYKLYFYKFFQKTYKIVKSFFA